MYSNEYIQEAVEPVIIEQDDKQASKSLTAKITTYLRWLGFLLIVLSAISFMLQGYGEIPPAYRYWVGLGLTLLLCGGGLVCAYLFNETKGARIFFGLGTAFLSVQVSQISSMLYAYLYGSNALQPEFTSLQFNNVAPVTISIDFAITGLLLFLISYASYSILARKYLKTLLWTSVISNLMLILPIREETTIPFIIAGLFIFLRKIEQKLHNDSSMRLLEGLAARALISLPLWIIVGRSILHPTSSLLITVILAMVVVYCIYDIKRYTKSSSILYISQWIGTFAAIAIWINGINKFGDFSNTLSYLPIAFILFMLSSQVNYHARLYRFISSVLTMWLSYSAMMDQQDMSIAAPVMTITAGILLTISGIKYREKISFFSGNVCVAGGFLFYWEYALNLYSNAPWISSIALGLFVILLASYIENKENQIKAKSSYYFNELKSWN
ncbi:MAG: hypothetical protein KAT04_01680 [Methylococcales bacterium]|nr:hypothetical protein [Methylococcales bacterium]